MRMSSMRNSSTDLSDHNELRTETTRTSHSPPDISTTPSVSSLQSFSWDKKSLDGLGYLQNNADNLLGYLKTVSRPLYSMPSTDTC